MNRFNDHRVMLCLVLGTIALYLWLRMDHGWIPHDEGLLGQAAERVLHGEMPHIDFDDPYTGGQAMLHALSFKLFGIRSYSIRIVLFAFSLLATFTTYSLAARFTAPWLAGLLTWTCVAWSVPNYFAALPSWYNLFFAMVGTLALIKHDETNKNRWLIMAGTMGGLSFLFKLSGLFFVAGGLLFLVFREQTTSGSEPSEKKNRSLFIAFCAASLAGFVALLVMLIRQRLTLMDTTLFVVPGAALSLFLVINEWKYGGGISRDRFERLIKPILWFIAGAGIPILIFLIPYWFRSGISELIQGVFVLPQKRMKWADYPLPPIQSLLASIPLGLLLLVPFFTNRRIDTLWTTVIAALTCIMGVMLGASEPIYQAMWDTARPLIPLAVIVGCLVLMVKPSDDDEEGQARRRLLFLLLSMASMVSLVQFPYSFGIYFCYAAPFVVLAVAAATRQQAGAPLRIHACVLGLYFGFGILWLNQGRVQRIGVQFVPQNNDTRLAISRSGLWMPQSQADLYERVIAEVTAHSAAGDFIYATVDCPEIYFLAGRKNPTRTFYDFFEPDFESEPAKRIPKIAMMLDQSKVDVIVFHWQGEFSGAISFELAGSLAEQYPNVKHFVRNPSTQPDDQPVFSVAWRDRTPGP